MMLALLVLLSSAFAADCPEGTDARSAHTADGRVAWCALPGGTWHGPMTRWSPDGQKAADGHYVDGEPAGEWVLYHPSGRVARSGNMAAGAPTGTWKTWTREGAWLGNVRYLPVETGGVDTGGVDTGGVDTGGGAGSSLELPADPRVLWTVSVGGKVHALDLMDDVLIVAATRRAYALDRWSGETLWTVPTGYVAAGDLRVDDGLVAWADTGGGLVVVDVDLAISWRVALNRPLQGLVDLTDEGALLQDDDGHEFLVDLDTGEVIWEAPSQVPAPSSDPVQSQAGAQSLEPSLDALVRSVGGEALAPIVTDTIVFVGSRGGTVVALDRRLARALADPRSGDAELYSLDILLNAWPDVWGYAGQPAVVPLLVVDQPVPFDACQPRRAVLDLTGLLPVEPVEADATGVVPLLVREAALDWWTGEGAWFFYSSWDPALVSSSAEVSYLYEWQPRITEIRPSGLTSSLHGDSLHGDDERFEAELKRLLACESAGLKLTGGIEVQDGRIRRRYEGRIRVQSFLHDVDGQVGCLHDVFVNDEPVGVYVAGDLPGWMDLHVVVQDADGLDLPDDGTVAFPAGSFDSSVAIETMGQGDAERSLIEHLAPVTLSLEADWLVVSSDGMVTESMPVFGLRYASPDPDTGLPSVLRRQVWRLDADTLPPEDRPFVELWSGLGCPLVESPDAESLE